MIEYLIETTTCVVAKLLVNLKVRIVRKVVRNPISYTTKNHYNMVVESYRYPSQRKVQYSTTFLLKSFPYFRIFKNDQNLCNLHVLSFL